MGSSGYMWSGPERETAGNIDVRGGEGPGVWSVYVCSAWTRGESCVPAGSASAAAGHDELTNGDSAR